MKTTKGTVDELFDRLRDGEPWLVDINEDENFIIFHDIFKICWCCGSIRSEHHFITWGDGVTYDHIIGYCVEPYVDEPCLFARYGSTVGVICFFKDAKDAKCNLSGEGKDVKQATIDYLELGAQTIRENMPHS